MSDPDSEAAAMLRQMRRGRTGRGALLGAVCGFLTYWSGAFLMALPDLLRLSQTEAALQLARPLRVITGWELVIVAAGALMGAAVGRYRWRTPGLLNFVGLSAIILGYLVYSVTISIPQVPPSERWLSYVLLVAEGSGLLLILLFSFYSLDATTRRWWGRLAARSPWDPQLRPKVAALVPVYNEPFDIVQQTVAHLLRQDYPDDRLVVVVADDSTDPEARRKLSEYCEAHGAKYLTRPERIGYKAGALNYAMKLLDDDVELIAVVDADYWVQPNFLRSVAGYFVNPRLSFVQTPQDYRNRHESFLTRQYKRAEAYFYHAVMPSRNEQSAIIFCGTMGVIRRSALEDVGGFDEEQVCEDADLSVRLAVRGWQSLYLDRSFGHGLMPAVFDAYKKQYHRWAFGNVKILFARLGMILRSRKMTKRQKLDFIAMNLHWFDGVFVLAIASVLLYLGLAPFGGYSGVTHHQREIALVGLVPVVLLFDSVLRLHVVLRSVSRSPLRDALLVQGMWLSIKMTNLAAVTKALLGVKMPFVRTPKFSADRMSRTGAVLRSVRLTKFETAVGVLLLTVAVANRPQWPAPQHEVLLPLWLALYGLFFLCAPIYAYLSYRTSMPLRYATLTARDPRPSTTLGRRTAAPLLALAAVPSAASLPDEPGTTEGSDPSIPGKRPGMPSVGS